MNCKLEVHKIKERLSKMSRFKGKCYVCDARKSRKGFTFHHLWYNFFDDAIYSNYPKTAQGQLDYYKDLEKYIKENPKRFLYLCNICHNSLERLNRFGDKKLGRLLKARKLTKTRR